MLPYRDSRITKIALAVFFLIVVGYGYFEAQGLLFGPMIAVESSVTRVHDPLISVKGKAERIASLTMNGRAIPVTESGAFDEPYMLAPGYNRIVLDAKDTYGRSSRKVIEIVYAPLPMVGPAEETGNASSSTPHP
ncbi:MAG: Glucodextranase, domain [Candidatus Parcubacteria bacterium]|jgi:hypothetical protein